MSKKHLRRTLTAADHDAQGNVVVWDHGPSEPANVDKDSTVWRAHEASRQAWVDRHGPHPVPMQMSAGDAGQALQADRRYALEPDLDNGEVEEEMGKIKTQREEAAKVAAERADAVQIAADRKAAIAIVAARHRADDLARNADEADERDADDRAADDRGLGHDPRAGTHVAVVGDAPAGTSIDPAPAPAWTPPPTPPHEADAPSSENHIS